MCGQADPTFLRCTIAAKKCGARLYDSARGRFERCAFERCGEQGIKTLESSAPVLSKWVLRLWLVVFIVSAVQVGAALLPGGSACLVWCHVCGKELKSGCKHYWLLFVPLRHYWGSVGVVPRASACCSSGLHNCTAIEAQLGGTG